MWNVGLRINYSFKLFVLLHQTPLYQDTDLILLCQLVFNEHKHN